MLSALHCTFPNSSFPFTHLTYFPISILYIAIFEFLDIPLRWMNSSIQVCIVLYVLVHCMSVLQYLQYVRALNRRNRNHCTESTEKTTGLSSSSSSVRPFVRSFVVRSFVRSWGFVGHVRGSCVVLRPPYFGMECSSAGCRQPRGQ